MSKASEVSGEWTRSELWAGGSLCDAFAHQALRYGRRRLSFEYAYCAFRLGMAAADAPPIERPQPVEVA